MSKTFSIITTKYGKQEYYRKDVPLSETMPKDHIHTALYELYIYNDEFESIKDIEVVVQWYEQAEDGNGYPLQREEKHEYRYSWSGSDYESFSDFHMSITSKKFKI